MGVSLRVLVVEHGDADSWIADQLLADYDIDFSWQCVASPHELCRLAADFGPDIVLCAEDVSVSSSRAMLDALQLLGFKPNDILISRVRKRPASLVRNSFGAASPTRAQDDAHWRTCFSSLLESTPAPAVISDANGWITQANAGACHRLDESQEHLLGSLLGAPADQTFTRDGRHHLAYFDTRTRLPAWIPMRDLIDRVMRRAGADLAARGMAPRTALANEPRESARRSAVYQRRNRLPSQSGVGPPLSTAISSALGVKLGDAVRQHTLSIHYQPQFELHTGRGCGVEALARWTLSTGQNIAPSIFIALAERTGVIQALGAWVLQTACDTAFSWHGGEAHHTTLSVNVSAHQINEEFCAVIAGILRKSRFPARHLELEITESVLVENTELTIECLKQWKRLGVQIAVDDFGTGYSSLNYLARLPVDRLKLDRSLIHRMTLDARSKIVMRSVISLGADLGIDVMAEGVETEEQFSMLEELGCPKVQGYLLARPMPPKEAQLTLQRAWGDRRHKTLLHPSRVPAGEFLVQ